MDRGALVETAKIICEGDTFKAQLLLNLISGIIELDKEEKRENEKIAEINCLWQKEGKCWVNMPDSVHKCYGRCEDFSDLNKYKSVAERFRNEKDMHTR